MIRYVSRTSKGMPTAISGDNPAKVFAGTSVRTSRSPRSTDPRPRELTGRPDTSRPQTTTSHGRALAGGRTWTTMK